MPILHRDYESRSVADLKKVGARRYAADPTTSVLCICYAVDDGPIESFVPEDGKPAPDVFYEAARNPDWLAGAHNAPFEQAVDEFVVGPRFGWPQVPIERHVCTMALARYHGLPGELGKAAKLLKLPFQKDREGARLMLKLCRPRKPRKGEDPTQIYWNEPTPEELARLVKYCEIDVAVERAIHHQLPALPEEEARLWVLDRKINAYGFRADLDFAGAAVKLVETEKAHINAEITALTNGVVTRFTKTEAMRAFVNARGHNMKSFDADAVAAVLAGNPDACVRALLELRQASNNPSVSKYVAVLAGAFPDERIRGSLNYYGTHTGRWTGSGLNVHNLPREDSSDALAAIDAVRRGDLEAVRAFGPPIEVIGRLARGVVVAPSGRLLLAGDFSMIEPRVASWFSEEEWKLATFREFDCTGDPMLDAHRVVGAQMQGKPVDPKDDTQRQRGKTVHMALNYGGGVRVWRDHVPNDPRSDEEIKLQEIDKFRKLHPAQTQFMFDLDRQALQCVYSRQPYQGKRHSFTMEGDTLILWLPSGRPQFYPRAHLKEGRFGQSVVAYHNPAKNCEDEMWYGAWFAHLVSATSRDLLVNALFKLDATGFDVILHVHDEVVAEIDAANASALKERFKACMVDAPAWAEGLPFATKVRTGERYLKTDAPAKAKAESGIEALKVSHIVVEAAAPSVCAECHLDPPDGGERVIQQDGGDAIWLHADCEDAYLCRRLAEEGIAMSTASTEQAGELAREAHPLPPTVEEALDDDADEDADIGEDVGAEVAPESNGCEITVFSKDGGILTKKISPGPGDTIIQDKSACVMSRGSARRAPIADLYALADQIVQLQQNQALALGTLRDGVPDEVKIVTEKELNGQANTIARTRDAIVYRENHPGLVLLDHDRGGMPGVVAERLKGGFWEALTEVAPDLLNAGHMVRASTSAGLFNSETGVRYEGSGGLHDYIMARDGSDARRFLTTLHERCWLHGLGWIKLGIDGKMLECSVIDRAVWGSERLVFEAPPFLVKPLAQDQACRQPIVHDGGLLDTRAGCPPLTPEERKTVAKLKQAAREQMQGESDRVREAYVESNAEVIVARDGISKEAALAQVRNRCQGVLQAGEVLEFVDKALDGCTVGDVLADPKRFDRRVLADPIEGTTYGRTTAIVMLRRSDNHPWIKSFAHGGRSFTLEHDADAGVKLKDFHAYMPMHNYMFAPSREPWPASSVNARIPPVVIGVDDEGEEIKMSANVWLDKNQPVEMMTWAPGLPMIIPDRLIAIGGWIERKGVACFNLYRPPTIRLGNGGDAAPWLELVHKVYPADADHLIKWFASRVQHPEIKINHGLVMGSNGQGIGKDTILEGVKRAVGPWNCIEISPKNIFDSFNPWKRSVILRVSEAKDMGEVSRFELYEAMKTLMAAPPDVLECNEKYIKQHYVLNCTGAIITTNHLTDGIYLPAEDRRHYVSWSDCVPTNFDPDYWNEMWEWYAAGGDCHVAAYLTEYDLSGFDPKAQPLKTPAFWSIVNANRSTEESELQDILDKLGNPDAVTLSQMIEAAPPVALLGEHSLREWLGERKNRKAFNHRLESCGYRAVPNSAAKDGYWKIGERRQVVYAKVALPLNEQLKAAENLRE